MLARAVVLATWHPLWCRAVISAYFEEKGLVRQQLDSFNDFINTSLQARLIHYTGASCGCRLGAATSAARRCCCRRRPLLAPAAACCRPLPQRVRVVAHRCSYTALLPACHASRRLWTSPS